MGQLCVLSQRVRRTTLKYLEIKIQNDSNTGAYLLLRLDGVNGVYFKGKHNNIGNSQRIMMGVNGVYFKGKHNYSLDSFNCCHGVNGVYFKGKHNQ